MNSLHHDCLAAAIKLANAMKTNIEISKDEAQKLVDEFVQMIVWQPIETAPNDKDLLLAHIKDGQIYWVVKASWSISLTGHITCASSQDWEMHPVPISMGQNMRGEQMVGGYIGKTYRPTHWMPIPAADRKENNG